MPLTFHPQLPLTSLRHFRNLRSRNLRHQYSCSLSPQNQKTFSSKKQSPSSSLLDLTLYLITDSRLVPREQLPFVVERAIKGGVTIVQLREKQATLKEIVTIGRSLKKVTDMYDVPLIINDNVEAAIELEASGVHVGQDDLDMNIAREKMGGSIIGVSCGTVEEAKVAMENGADYIGVGAVYRTGTKVDAGSPIGVEGLRGVVEGIGGRRVVAIGGIGQDGVGEIAKCGVGGVAVISAIMGKGDPEKEARVLKQEFLVGRREFGLKESVDG